MVSEQLKLMPEAAVTHKTSLRLSSTHPKARRQLVPPVPGRLGAVWACPSPSPPSHPSAVSQFPPSQGYQGKEKHLRVKRDRTTRHLHSLAAQAKCQGVGIPRAAGCLDFSQGIFGKCQNRNLLTKTCNVSIQAWPRDRVQTLLFQQFWGALNWFSGQNVWSFGNA